MRLAPRTGEAGTRLDAFLLAGDTRATGWVRALLQDELPAQDYGRALLSPSARPPVAVAPRGAQVCSCFDVTEPQIVQTLARCTGTPESRLSQLQAALKCGTNCGSCLPALRTLERTALHAA
jgi:assimilatory nitrate reductase catalytic subunit